MAVTRKLLQNTARRREKVDSLSAMDSVLDAAMERSPAAEDFHERSPASITVTRTSEEDIKERQIVVSLDGERVATLLHGDSVTRQVEPGPHRLRVHNTLFWKTLDFTLKPGEEAYFEVINRAGFGTYTLLLILGAAPLYVTFRRML
jgi:hypothetical protein